MSVQPRHICRVCKQAPSEVRVMVQIVEKQVKEDGTIGGCGPLQRGITRSVCQSCADAFLDTAEARL